MKRITLLFLLLSTIAPRTSYAQRGWYPVHVPVGYWDVDVANDSELAIFSGSSTSISHNGGLTWKTQKLFHYPSDTDSYKSIKLLPPDTLIIYGSRYLLNLYPQFLVAQLIATSYNEGSSWNIKQSGSLHDQFDQLTIGHTTPRWIYGLYEWNAPYRLEHYATDGRTGKSLWSTNSPYVQNMHFTNDSIGMAIGATYPLLDERVLVTLDGATSWHQQTLSFDLADSVHKVPSVHPGASGFWYVSNGPELLISKDTGTTWSSLHFFDQTIQEFQFFDSVGYVVLQNADFIMKTTNAGVTWFAQSCYNGRDPVSYVVPTSRTHAYAWLEGAQTEDIMRIDDGGLSSAPVLSAPRTLDFGTLSRDVVATKSVRIKNVGAQSLAVTGFIADAPNVSVAPASFALAPGDTTLITISYSTHNGAGDDIRLRLLTNTAPKEEVFHVQGAALAPVLSFSSHTIDFGQVLIGERQTKHLRLRNRGSDRALFLAPLVGSFLFGSETPDSLDAQLSETFSVQFAPELPLTYDARLIIRSNAVTWDTLTLHGTGVSTLTGTERLQWQRNNDFNDTLHGDATNILTTDPNRPVVLGVIGKDDSTASSILAQYDASGNLLRSTTLESGLSELDAPSALAADSLGGNFVAHTPNNASLAIAHINALGDVTWRDTLVPKATAGVSASFPVSVAANSKGQCGLMVSGFRYATDRDAAETLDPGQILFRLYAQDGRPIYTDTINGTADYRSAKPILFDTDGQDFGSGLAVYDSNFIACLALDFGGGVEFTSPFLANYHSILQLFSASVSNVTLAEHDKQIAGPIVIMDTTIFEAGRSTDSGFYVERFTFAGDSLGFARINPSTGIDSLYWLAVDRDGSAYIAGTMPTDLDGKDVSLLHLSPSGTVLWQKSFNGLGAADDIPIKLLADQGSAYLLVRSEDTSGNDWVLLKYDSSGQEQFRMRYDGAGHGDDVPHEFGLGSAGCIYVVGAATNAKGVQEFTVIKYIDSTVANAHTHVANPLNTFDARLTPNPWSSDTKLELSKPRDTQVVIHIFDLLGREYFSRTTTANEIEFNSQNFPPGFYTISIEDVEGSRKLLKFIRE